MPSEPSGSGDAICRPYSSRRDAIDLEQLDVDYDLGPRLVDRRDQIVPRRRCAPACPSAKSSCRVVMGEICLTSTTMRRRSMTSLMSALLRKKVRTTDSSVLAAFGRRVRHNRDRALRR